MSSSYTPKERTNSHQHKKIYTKGSAFSYDDRTFEVNAFKTAQLATELRDKESVNSKGSKPRYFGRKSINKSKTYYVTYSADNTPSSSADKSAKFDDYGIMK